MFEVPKSITTEIESFSSALGGFPKWVLLEPSFLSDRFHCHDNCKNSIHPTIKGFYIVKNLSIGCLEAFSHSIIKRNNILVDITPQNSDIDKILFVESDLEGERYSYLENSIYINSFNLLQIREERMFYVYGLVDPRNNKIFYIGKGKGDRWKSHLTEKKTESSNLRKFNKIEKIKSKGLEIGVEFLATGIPDEDVAYAIEELYIKMYGRINYDDNGILTNICESSIPPNHKGMSYQEIYGDRAEIERKKRHLDQLSRGGYFKGRKHSEESKKKISESEQKEKNPNYSGLTEKDYLEHGRKFCELFESKINKKKWLWYCQQAGIPPAINTFRFQRKNILKVFEDEFDADVIFDKKLWYCNLMSKEQFRISDWEMNMGIKEIPNGFLPGRIR